MYPKSFARIIIALFVLIAVYTPLKAQPILPDIIGATDKGINVLSWTCQYEGMRSIGVQRSSDSIFNFVTIGYVKNLKKGPQAFIDGHPAPGKNFYRLYIVFGSDLTWYSNRFRIDVDSATIMRKGVVPPNDSLQKLAGKVRIDTLTGKAASNNNPITKADSLQNTINNIRVSIPVTSDVDAYSYIKSDYVFTNPFTGHVTMELPDVRKLKYSVAFFDQKNRKVFEIPRVTESPVIIDKRNFQKKGIFKFELSKEKEKMETGYITIY